MNDRHLADKLAEYAKWADANEYEVPIDLADLLREAAERLSETKADLRTERDALCRDLALTRRELARAKSYLRIYSARAERAERERTKS